MATEVKTVYKQFLAMINDKEWLLVDEDVIEDLMFTYLQGTVSEFDVCRKSLELKDNQSFVEDLSPLEIKILSKGMLLEYLNPKIIREENLRQAISTKDYHNLSNANMLDKLLKLKKIVEEDYEELLNKYDYLDFKGLN